eukprot:9346476-Pyramimonas_sp.AAC.1
MLALSYNRQAGQSTPGGVWHCEPFAFPRRFAHSTLNVPELGLVAAVNESELLEIHARIGAEAPAARSSRLILLVLVRVKSRRGAVHQRDGGESGTKLKAVALGIHITALSIHIIAQLSCAEQWHRLSGETSHIRLPPC